MKRMKAKSTTNLKDHFKKRFWQRLHHEITNDDIAIINKMVREGKWLSCARQSITRLLVVLQSDKLSYKDKFIAIYNKNLKSVVTCFQYVGNGQQITYNDTAFILTDEKGENDGE